MPRGQRGGEQYVTGVVRGEGVKNRDIIYMFDNTKNQTYEDI